MLDYAIKPPRQPYVPINGSDIVFPVRRIYCVGQNYAKHITEMGGPSRAQDRKPPFFFQKPRDAIVLCNPELGATIPYPKLTTNLHHEVEMVLAIGKGGDSISKADANAHIFALGVGVDLTRRDRQAEMKAAGRSWEIAKAFDNSAPISNLTRVNAIPARAQVELLIDGAVRQSSNIDQMIWNPAEIVAALSTQYTLYPGDLVYSGTPEGVGPINRGEHIQATLNGFATLSVTFED